MDKESSSFVHGRVMYSMRYWDSVQRKTTTNHGQNIEAMGGRLYRWVMVEKISNCMSIDRMPLSPNRPKLFFNPLFVSGTSGKKIVV